VDRSACGSRLTRVRASRRFRPNRAPGRSSSSAGAQRSRTDHVRAGSIADWRPSPRAPPPARTRSRPRTRRPAPGSAPRRHPASRRVAASPELPWRASLSPAIPGSNGKRLRPLRPRDDWALDRTPLSKSTTNNRNLRTSLSWRRPSQSRQVAGVSRPLERSWPMTENRGVPGSSPGLAIAKSRVTSRFTGFRLAPGTTRTGLARATKGDGLPRSLPTDRAAIPDLGSPPAISQPTRTDHSTSSPSGSLRFDSATPGRSGCTVAAAAAAQPERTGERRRNGDLKVFSP
jgi:hypothetical protein